MRPPAPPPPARILGLREAVLLIVGVVVGAGIFKAPSVVASATGHAGWMFLAWLFGGAVSLAGALCYAELATAYSHPGGEYHFLKRAYGRGLAFLFAWARFSVITTSSIALLAFVFGDYMQQVLPLTWGRVPGATVYALACIALLWMLNERGLRSGARAQSWLTAIVLAGLMLIVLSAFWLVALEPAASAAAAAPSAPAAAAAAGPGGGLPGPAAFGLAMVFVLLTYGGWNEAGYISAELKGGRRDMVRALVLSVLVLTGMYLAVTWAYWRALGMEGMAQSQALAADLLGLAFGATGAAVISLLVAVASLTSINATMIVGARCNYAVACDWDALARFSFWDGEGGTPRGALRMQNAAAMLLVLLGAWAGAGFEAVVEFAAPVFWLFFLLTGLSLFVLRWREPLARRPFRVPLYPLVPAVFCASCGYMLWSSVAYVGAQRVGGVAAGWIGVAVLASGVLVLAAVQLAPGNPPLAGRPAPIRGKRP
ncbi:APC family permease [Ramlibacter sp. AN1015]|uniref:APC family permease n=1 Tax=Ramlibacter sp. AN1015 TaxID=3133428 RepID=UPI0030C2F6CC